MRKPILFFVLFFLTFLPADVFGKRASLKGSIESRRLENIEIDKEGLMRIQTKNDLEGMKTSGLLIPLPENNYLEADPRLNIDYAWCLPQVNDFLILLSRDFHKNFPKSGHKIQINSAVRTAEYQEALQKRNRNATESTGPLASSHTTGATIDIAKLNLSEKELRWMRNYLLKLEKADTIEATEEHYQAVFHIMVFK